jgi:hypothetical protein
MDGNTVLLLVALMILVGVVLVNVVIAGTVLRLEHYRTERDKSSGAAPAAGAPRAANLYVAALLVSGVPLVAFFGAMLGAFSAGGWAYVAAGAASVGAIVGAVNLCASPLSTTTSDGDVSAAEDAPATNELPTLSVVTADEPVTDDENNENAPEEHRTPDDANG